jgi:hypothetical protein
VWVAGGFEVAEEDVEPEEEKKRNERGALTYWRGYSDEELFEAVKLARPLVERIYEGRDRRRVSAFDNQVEQLVICGVHSVGAKDQRSNVQASQEHNGLLQAGQD